VSLRWWIVASEEVGSATLLLIGGIAVVAVCLSAIGGALLFGARDQLERQSEEMAISGADTLSGRLPGYPCQKVSELAHSQSITVESCAPEGLEIRIEVSKLFGAIKLSAHTHAGPPR
jgi:hypothetical protein